MLNLREVPSWAVAENAVYGEESDDRRYVGQFGDVAPDQLSLPWSLLTDLIDVEATHHRD